MKHYLGDLVEVAADAAEVAVAAHPAPPLAQLPEPQRQGALVLGLDRKPPGIRFLILMPRMRH